MAFAPKKDLEAAVVNVSIRETAETKDVKLPTRTHDYGIVCVGLSSNRGHTLKQVINFLF